MRKLLAVVLLIQVASSAQGATLSEKLGPKCVDSILRKVATTQVDKEAKKFRRKISLKEDFLAAVRPKVLATTAPDKRDAASWLAGGRVRPVCTHFCRLLSRKIFRRTARGNLEISLPISKDSEKALRRGSLLCAPMLWG